MALKRLLQIAWFENDQANEMAAYSLIAKQYFYMSDLHKSAYYMDRAMRGKFEVKTSKVRELSMI